MNYNSLINWSLVIQKMSAQGYHAPLPMAMPKAMKTGSDRAVVAVDGHLVFRMKKGSSETMDLAVEQILTQLPWLRYHQYYLSIKTPFSPKNLRSNTAHCFIDDITVIIIYS